LRARRPDILQSIRSTGDLTDETAAKLKAAVDAYAAAFA
jgi:F-type H+-transporting ATPase subunit alpha